VLHKPAVRRSARADAQRAQARRLVLAARRPYRASLYFDGEALLALAKAARYLGRDDLRPVLAASALELASLAPTVVELGDWVLDVHHVVDRERNTGYAVEGLVHAYVAATKLGDGEHAAKFRDAIEDILAHIMTWQIGAPHANACIRDVAAVGGVQNAESDPVLRIDVALHQLHAIMLTLAAFYPEAANAAPQ
jgi:hypothetical protein